MAAIHQRVSLSQHTDLMMYADGLWARALPRQRPAPVADSIPFHPKVIPEHCPSDWCAEAPRSHPIILREELVQVVVQEHLLASGHPENLLE